MTFDELLAYLERGESFHDEAVHTLEGMLLLLRSKEVPGNSQVSDHRLEAAVAEIRKNPSHKWDFDLISQKIGLSAAHFRRRFRSVYGHPPSRFVFRLRMERSAELIRGSGARFMEIADAMGFEDINYWHKCFRRHFGISAGAYRREFMAG